MKKIVFLTGAGISAESGIPTFRDSVNGIWENYPVNEVATHKALLNNPDLVYGFCNELRKKYAKCEPNYAHKTIANLEKNYEVHVITQNIDNLHEQAGSSNVLHLHGEINKVRSVNNYDMLFDCSEDITPETVIEGHKVRPHVVLFGESVPNYKRAIPLIKQADICVVIGTSLSVYPAADLINYVDIDNPIYYIDPNPAYIPEDSDIKVIKATATEGMQKLIKIIL